MTLAAEQRLYHQDSVPDLSLLYISALLQSLIVDRTFTANDVYRSVRLGKSNIRIIRRSHTLMDVLACLLSKENSSDDRGYKGGFQVIANVSNVQQSTHCRSLYPSPSPSSISSGHNAPIRNSGRREALQRIWQCYIT
jgi:hypothetical protein